jgi:esterase/lipase
MPFPLPPPPHNPKRDDDDECSPQSALTCVEFATRIQRSFADVTVPFLCMIADEDVVVDNDMARELMDRSPSADKTLKSYAALHGLLCEPAPLLGIIEDDFVQWVLERCPRY